MYYIRRTDFHMMRYEKNQRLQLDSYQLNEVGEFISCHAQLCSNCLPNAYSNRNMYYDLQLNYAFLCQG